MKNRILIYMAFAVVTFVSFTAGEYYAIGARGKELLILAQEVCAYHKGRVYIPAKIGSSGAVAPY